MYVYVCVCVCICVCLCVCVCVALFMGVVRDVCSRYCSRLLVVMVSRPV